jgi:hypothetical protein
MNQHNRELVLAAVIYTGFFGAIVGAIAITGSAWCLWALVLTPSVNIKGKDNDVK